MLFNEATIEVVAAQLAGRRHVRLVVDPVMVATSGDRLLQASARASLVAKLFPLADLITPNIPEASVLVGPRRLVCVCMSWLVWFSTRSFVF